MTLRLLWIPALALAAACSSPVAPSSTGAATGARTQAFSIGDQPPIPSPNSRPSDAPPEFFEPRANSASTGALFEWRVFDSAVRWQLEIRNIPGDNVVFEAHTIDVRPVYEWLPKPSLLNHSFEARVRSAWFDGAVSNWTPWKRFSIGERPTDGAPTCWDYQSMGDRPYGNELPTCGWEF